MRAVDLDGIGMTSYRTRARLIQRLSAQGIHSKDVLEVIQNTPRHLFVDEALAHRAYEDTSLPIGYNQTLSQPYTVARMTEALVSRGKLQSVLEIGAGSGYQTAILAQLVPKVYSIERIKPLLERAKERLRLLSLPIACFKLDDGRSGWPYMSPFDGIMVTAAPDKVPSQLLQQLQPDGGRMVIPVGRAGEQKLLLIVRTGRQFRQQVLESVRFVPMLKGTMT